MIDFKTAFAELKMLEGRTPTSSEADRGGIRSAGGLSGRRGSRREFAGTSAWERHPVGDEIVQIVEGATTPHLLTDAGKQSLALKAGMMAIVPRDSHALNNVIPARAYPGPALGA